MRRAAPAAAAALTLALPGVANAATMCVNNPGGACDQSFNASQLQDALTAAEGTAEDDTVRIAPGSYTRLGGFSFAATTSGAVEIEGAGASQTTLEATPDAGADDTLSVSAGDSAGAVRDLTISMPAAMSSGDRGLALFNASTAERVTVEGETGLDNARGVGLSDSSFSEGTIALPLANGIRGLLAGGNSSVTDSDITAQSAIGHSDPNHTLAIVRARIEAESVGIGVDGGTITIEDSLIDLGSFPNSAGLSASNQNPGVTPMAIDARHLTIVGGGTGSLGLQAIGDNPSQPTNQGENATVTLRDSVISGPPTPISVLADNGESATVTTEFSNYDPAGNVVNNDHNPPGGATGTAVLTQTNQTNFAPGFLNPAAGNYRPVIGSALIDAGNPAGGGPALDLDRSPRVLDGDGTGSPRRDIGAYELDDLVGPSASVTAGPSGPTGDATPTFEFASSEPGSSFVCRIDGGPFAPCSGPGDSHTAPAALDDGSHRFEVRPTDPTGNVGTVGSRAFAVDASAPVIQLGGPTGPISDSTPTFSFSSGEQATFECRFDDAAFGPCSGPGNTHTPSPLADGLRTFEVRATDALGNAAQSSASVSIDATGPETTAQKPKAKGDDVKVRFGADEPAVTFMCKLDKGAFAPCTSPKKYRNLDRGKHTVSVVGSDSLGNPDPTPATRKFKIG